MKKKIVLSLSIMIGMIVNGQVAIGKTVNNTSALLDFKESTTSGIILPRLGDPVNLTGRPSLLGITIQYYTITLSPGTIFYNCYTGEVSYAKALSINSYESLSDSRAKTTCNRLINQSPEDKGVIIGAETSDAKGVLVLESNNKALLLPKVANAYKEIKSPVAGTLVYDPTNKVLSVYNGETWTFWSNE